MQNKLSKFIIIIITLGLHHRSGSSVAPSSDFNPIAIRLLEYQIEKLQILVDELEVNVTQEIEECNCNETLANLTSLLETLEIGNPEAPDDLEIVSDDQSFGANYEDCQQIFDAGSTENSVYEIWVPDLFDYLLVYCDMETETRTRGWITILQRFNGTTYFSRDYSEFQTGFGSPLEEFWVGLDNIYQLTRDDGSRNVNASLRFDIEDTEGVKAYAEYERFKIGGKDENYAVLKMSNYIGNATDISTGMLAQDFRTQDQNNPDGCVFKGGFWMSNCESANLNAPYPANVLYSQAYKLSWPNWVSMNPNNPNIKSVSMKIQIRRE